MRVFVAFLLLAGSVVAIAQDLRGTVVGVTDGDTIKLLTSNRQEVKVRLEGIDAPERGQAFGTKSKEHLSKLVFRKSVTVRVTGKDKYGRTLGIVMMASIAVNRVMVSDGFAWWFRKYAPTNRSLQAAEDAARRGRLGLWRDPQPVAPWDWRKQKKTPSAG